MYLCRVLVESKQTQAKQRHNEASFPPTFSYPTQLLDKNYLLNVEELNLSLSFRICSHPGYPSPSPPLLTPPCGLLRPHPLLPYRRLRERCGLSLGTGSRSSCQPWSCPPKSGTTIACGTETSARFSRPSAWGASTSSRLLCWGCCG